MHDDKTFFRLDPAAIPVFSWIIKWEKKGTQLIWTQDKPSHIYIYPPWGTQL